ncbi:MAG: hypothetical protein AB7T14_03130 [Candidatus Methylacidiphilaceae bacterium]
MPFDWREYLKLAKELSGTQSVADYSLEAAYRSATSRAYYAAFCWARNYAKQCLEFKPTRKADDHVRLSNYLGARGKIELASHLRDLRLWRNICDYEEEVVGLHDMVNTGITYADKVIAECK